MSQNRGILIQKVVNTAILDASFVNTGDVIVGFNHVAVGSVDELYLQLNEQLIGKTTEMDILKKGVKKTVMVTLGEA